MKSKQLYELLVSTASKSLELKDRNYAYFSPGHNGPYKDPETPVRNTAHWCITFLKVYEITGNKNFLDAANKCGEYLISKEARPMESVFFCRKNPEKDFANGLVGQAWAIEALVELYKTTSDSKYIELAKDIFLLHTYDKKYGAWIRRNVDGSFNDFDRTFNHELWFAAAGGMLAEYNDEIKAQVSHFMNILEGHFEIYRDGCIRHKGMFLLKSREEVLKRVARKIFESPGSRKYMRMKSVGYHGFNLYAFALLKKVFPKHSFWNSTKFKKALAFAASDHFKKELSDSKYGFPYNPPGFEMAFAFQEFNYLSEKEISEWVSWQLKTCYNFETNLMTEGGTFDKETAAARIYEATRLKNYTLKLSVDEQ